MSATEEVRQFIQDRLAAIEAEVVSLNDALARLDANGSTATPHRGPRPPAGQPARRRPRAGSRRTARPRPGSRESPGPVSAEALELILRERDGAGISAAELAERLGAERTSVLARLKALEVEGNVRRTGERRTTRWFAITDEDRIRERAAELERRRRGTGDPPATGSRTDRPPRRQSAEPSSS